MPRRAPRARRLAVLALSLALSAGTGQPAAAQPLQLGRGEAIGLGRVLLGEGRVPQARAIAEALLAHDPDDAEAGVLMAAALSRLGQHGAAHRAALRAHLSGGEEGTRYESAMLAGRAAFEQGAFGRAQLWLRRAAQVAPDAATRSLAEQHFHRVRRINPLQLHFDFGVARSSNINGGTTADEIIFLGLPFRVEGASRALSGTEINAGVALRYRLAQGETSETALTFGAMTRSYVLSEAARRAAPELRAGDLASQQLEIGALHRFVLPGGRRMIQVSGGLGGLWHGGAYLGTHLRMGVAYNLALSAATSLELSLAGQRQRREDNALRSSDRLGLAAELRHRLGRGDQLTFRLAVQQTRSESIQIAHSSVQAQVSFALAEPVMGMRLSGFADLASRRFPAAPVLQPDGRQDLQGRVGLDVLFERVEYMGFSPTLRVQYGRTRSNLAIHEQRAFDVMLGIGSRF